MEFGSWLKERRQALDLTQAQLADMVGCAADTIRMIESGRRRPSREVAELLGKALQVAPAELAAFVGFARGSASPAPTPLTPLLSSAPQRPAGALPQLPSALIGRDEVRAEVVALLLGGKRRLVTLTGPAGIGKTSLAIEVAAELAGRFSDGIYFVPLAALNDPALVAAAIARVLLLSPPPDRPLVEALHDFLWTCNLLLVLDNFEQIMTAAGLVAEMLRLAPRLKVLVTSRGALKLRGEQEVVLAPLAVPAARQDAAAAAPGGLLEYGAVELFVERAAEARAGFQLTAANAAAVAEITRRLDGLPLAIELAAARSRILTPQAILERLGSSLELLADGPVDLPERQRTLRGAIAWGYDLLAPPEQALFRLLSVFSGGWTLEAAEAMAPQAELERLAAPGPAPTTLDLLDALARMSMLRVADPDGELRFGMLETIRDYAGEQLAARGEEERARRAHAGNFLRLAEAAEKEFFGPNPARWLDRLEGEHDNLRAALRWSLDSGEAALAVRLAGALWRFWWLHSHIATGRNWLLAALELDERAPADKRTPAASRAIALVGAGVLSRDQGDYALARSLLEQSVGLQRSLGDLAATADALTFLGVVLTNQSQFASARAHYDEASALAEQIGSKAQLSRALLNKGTTALSEGRYEEARGLYERALELSRELGSKANQGTTLHNLGVVHFQLGDLAQAHAYHEEGLAIRRELGNRARIASGLNHLGNILYMQGDKTEGRRLLEEALAIRREVGSRADVGSSLADLAAVLLDEHDYEAAQLYGRESLRLHLMTGAREAVAQSLVWLAGAAIGQGRTSAAARMLGAAESVREALCVPVSAVNRARYERIVAAGQAASNEAEWSREWSQGRATALESVAEAALRDA